MDKDHLDKIRYFDPLKYPQIKKTDLILHVPIMLTQGNKLSDIECFYKCYDSLSEASGFEGVLVISVNGFIEESFISDLHWLESLNKCGVFDVVVFQRPNYGYQWGGFYDVWQKYKDVDCEYYATLECDVLLSNDWYQKCVELIEDGYVGQPPYKELHPHSRTSYKFTDRLWSERVDDRYMHSRGGFYFCRRDLLVKLDQKFGHFTFSMGNDLEIDGIACGEIGFAVKTEILNCNILTLDHTCFEVIRE